jgi:hypothetical protein
MPLKDKKLIYLILVIILFGNLSIYFGFTLLFYVFKASTLPIFIYLSFYKLKLLKHPNIPLLIIAFFFTFLGGLLIHITLEEQLFVILTLCCYTMSHLVYSVLFYSSYKNLQPIKPMPRFLWGRWPEILVSFIFWSSILMVYPIIRDIIVPSISFAIIGYLSALLALNRRFYVDRNSFNWVIIGFILLYLGDIIAATDLNFSNSSSHIFVFTFNTSAHVFIYLGMMKQMEKESFTYSL